MQQWRIPVAAGDIGIQAAKTGMLASSPIIAEVAATWRRLGLSVPPVASRCASNS
ncbi:hypothetical protein MAHJHV55_51630 [Mycobacterium avium subsp. hominissuis]